MAAKPLKRIGLTAGLVLILVVVFGGGWFAARRFQSPAQREAAAAPPTAGPIFDKVTSGALSDDVSGSGTVMYSTVTPVGIMSLPTAAVVTATTKAVGSTVKPGDVITEINSRPVFLFPGKFDFYRDLSPGMTGRDIAQFQDGLRAAGFDIRDSESSTYGWQTAAAVKALYLQAGYSQPKTTVVNEQAGGGAQDSATVNTTSKDTAAAQPKTPAAGNTTTTTVPSGVPLTEIAVATGGLPATLEAAPAVGTHPGTDQPLVQLAHGGLVVSIQLDSSAFVKLKAGMMAKVTVTGAKRPLAAHVSRLIEPKSTGGTQGTGSSDAGQLPTAILTPSDTIDTKLVGRPAVAIVTIETVAAKSLLVPCRAVATTADHASRVIRRRDGQPTPAGNNATVQPVDVSLLGSLGGVCAVKPVTSDGLRTTDRVQVG